MRALVVAAVLAGCSGGGEVVPDAPDATPPDATTEWTGDYEWRIVTLGAPAGVEIHIDGEVRDRLEVVLAGEAEARTAAVVVETFVDGHAAAQYTVAADCDVTCDYPAAYMLRHDDVCIYGSGEIRYASTTCGTTHGTCVADGFCRPRCHPWTSSCREGLRCGLDRVDGDPTHGWLDCVAIGPRALDESCTIDASGIDDCGERLYCVDGVCRAACSVDGTCEGDTVCTPLPGMWPVPAAGYVTGTSTATGTSSIWHSSSLQTLSLNVPATFAVPGAVARNVTVIVPACSPSRANEPLPSCARPSVGVGTNLNG
jgi:hypothetical protein